MWPRNTLDGYLSVFMQDVSYVFSLAEDEPGHRNEYHSDNGRIINQPTGWEESQAGHWTLIQRTSWKITLWNLINETWDALAACFEPAIDHLIEASDLTAAWSLLLATLTCEPESIATADLMVRNPYTAAEVFQQRLANAARQGYLRQVEPDGYRLSVKGRKEAQRFIHETRQTMSNVDPLPAQDAQRLVRVFDRLVRACLDAPPPPDAWSLRTSYKLTPEPEPPLPFIEQSITCLSAYHDDCHLAAWQFAGLSATSFETLTLVWRNEAGSLDELVEKLDHRGHPREVYAQAVQELGERELIAASKGELMVTEGGRLFRNQLEADSDRFFFACWKELAYREKTELAGLLIRLKDRLMREVS
jgi:hypothetical protein